MAEAPYRAFPLHMGVVNEDGAVPRHIGSRMREHLQQRRMKIRESILVCATGFLKPVIKQAMADLHQSALSKLQF